MLIRRIRADPCSLPASGAQARLRVTRTPTVMLSAINYRLSAIGYPGHSPPAHNANSNGEPLGYQLEVLLIALAMRLFQIVQLRREWRDLVTTQAE